MGLWRETKSKGFINKQDHKRHFQFKLEELLNMPITTPLMP